MSAAEKAKKLAALDCEIPKVRLEALYRKLKDTPGATVAAKELGTIINKIERWQAKHG